MCRLESSNPRDEQQNLGHGARVVLRLYKLSLSPIFAAFGARCRYHPTCSEYAAGAMSHHGVWAGTWMSLARLARCHPFGGSGMDPVPEERPDARWYLPWRYGVWRAPAEGLASEAFAPSGDRPAKTEHAERTDDGSSTMADQPKV